MPMYLYFPSDATPLSFIDLIGSSLSPILATPTPSKVLSTSLAAPGCSRTPVFSNGPYRVTPHLTSQASGLVSSPVSVHLSILQFARSLLLERQTPQHLVKGPFAMNLLCSPQFSTSSLSKPQCLPNISCEASPSRFFPS